MPPEPDSKSGDLTTTQPAPEVQPGDVQMPPTQPTITVVWTVDEARALPKGTVITWMESCWDPDRHAAVVTESYDGEPRIAHTRQDYWESSLELIDFPALAFTWATDDGRDRRPAENPELERPET